MGREYRMCTRCIMDTTDPEIEFDDQGVCNHCHKYDRMVSEYVIEGEAGLAHLQELAQKIRSAGKRKRYDCIIGVSGGVDSTYVAYKTKQLGLRPLAVHLDNGWDSEMAVKNIEQTLKKLDIDLYTYVLDWSEFRDLQVSFLKASTPDSEIPTDHAIAAILGRMAEKEGVRYIILGTNVRTESHLPQSWSQGHHDWKYIRSVQARFGKARLKTFPFQSLFTYFWRSIFQKRVEILNYLDYDKDAAMQILQDELDWQYYGGKHFESIYTRFYQGYILPSKFGFDKRRAHLSSLICSGQISRKDALEEIARPTYQPTMQEEDREYVVKKLELTDDEFQEILDASPKSYWDYPSNGQLLKQPAFNRLFQMGRNVYRMLNGIREQ